MSSRSPAFTLRRLCHGCAALSTVAWLCACATRDALPSQKPAHAHCASEAKDAPGADAVSLEGWQAETFALPPSFAPDLPAGTESLRFSPGWRDPGAEGFWSYAFVMWIDEPVPDGARIDALLEKYYNGLMTSFAAGKGKDIGGTPARVDVSLIEANRYEARMHVVDAFATFEPMDVRMLVDAVAEGDGRSALQIRVSPQPREHAIWRSLRAAIADIQAGKKSTQPPAQGASAAAGGTAPFQVVSQLDKCIGHIFQDSRGTYWFSSPRGGLYRWSGTGNTFDHFTAASGLGDNDVSRIQEDRFGNLYISTSSGIRKFDGRTFTTLKLDESEPPLTEWKHGPDDLWFMCGGNDPHAVFYDGTSLRRLKVPTTPGGDAHFAMYPRSKYPNIRYSPYDAYTIYKDSRGNVWFGTASLGACRFDGKNFAWISEKELGFDEKDGRTFGTRCIMEDRDGKFWITVTLHRFDVYPPPGAAVTRSEGGLSYVKSAGLVPSKEGVDEGYTYVMSMVNDKAGDLWIATYGSGVWRYDGKTLTNYPVLVDGEPITVLSIYKDRQDALWLGTHEHGVCRFNGKSFEKVTF